MSNPSTRPSERIARSSDYIESNTNKAYDLQIRGALEGAARWLFYSSTAMFLAHHMSPFVRRQTLAGKAFVVTCGMVYGMCQWQEKYLLDFEHETRFKTDVARREALIDFARQGKLANELDIQKWITDKKSNNGS